MAGDIYEILPATETYLYLFTDDVNSRSNSSVDVPHVLVLQSTKVNATMDELVKKVGNGTMEADGMEQISKLG